MTTIRKLHRLLYLVLFTSLMLINNLFAQNNDDLFSVKNRIDFGNYLFDNRDYLRAVDEFNSVLKYRWSDSLQFKIGIAYYEMGSFNKAITEYKKIRNKNGLIKQGNLEIFRSYYQIGDFHLLRNRIDDYLLANGGSKDLEKLKEYTKLMDNSILPKLKVWRWKLSIPEHQCTRTPEHQLLIHLYNFDF